MGRINLLDTEISNKIAAGEVVERPASVVKELVENSIDAGADIITVEIKNGGNTYIKVSDNGCGMEKDDAAVAFLRHATSKISTEEDLNAIYTLGFRGEALSSIGAVAMVDLYTKRKEDNCGVHTVCEGGEIVSDDDAGVPDGTTFIVKSLFYNVPARMKFLKKDATEAGYISDIMTRFILSHPEISFKFINNGKVVLNSYGDGKLTNCIYSVYGKDYATSMINVDYSTEFVKVNGCCGKGSTARANRAYQSFFINGRYIKSPLIMRAVEEAYKNQIMIGKFPMAVLNLEINPSLVDINVHPTKLEVKFSNENEVYQAVYHSIKDALYRISDVPEIRSIKKEEIKPVFTPDKTTVNAQIEITEKSSEKKISEEIKKEECGLKNDFGEKFFQRFNESKKIVAEPKMFANRYQKMIEDKSDDIKTSINTNDNNEQKPVKNTISPTVEADTINFADMVSSNVEKTEKNAASEQKIEITDKKQPEFTESKAEEKKEYRLVGQLFDTYIIIESGEEMRIIDQHAAHERLKYEELKAAMEDRKIYSQGLLLPVVTSLSSVEFAVFEQNAEFIASLGFEAEDYGNNTVIIRSVPVGMIDDDIQGLFVEIIQQINDNKKEIITEKKERLLYTMACKSAIKANHRLNESEQKELINKVLELDNINTCPHGRPIIVSMSKKEIEKSFKRIV